MRAVVGLQRGYPEGDAPQGCALQRESVVAITDENKEAYIILMIKDGLPRICTKEGTIVANTLKDAIDRCNRFKTAHSKFEYIVVDKTFETVHTGVISG
jgi:hypothetical protein